LRRNKTYNGLGGFSSHASSMISSLKSNFRKRELTLLKGSKTKVYYGKFSSSKKATIYQLKNIRERLQLENRKKLKINVIILIISFILIIYIIGFVKF
jgi:hypothetical protein